MVKILLINPSRWGRGITPIWIASHSGILKASKYQTRLFDATFYNKWSFNEHRYNTDNEQYKPTDYEKKIEYKDSDIFIDLQKFINGFSPDIIFSSAISSHIHGEGEYVNIQYYNELLSKINSTALKIAGGLQPTAKPGLVIDKLQNIDVFIRGESEIVLKGICDAVNKNEDYRKLDGLVYRKDDSVIINDKQPIINDLSLIGNYDYSLFEPQIFLRSYNGNIIKAVDYELSRGCVYACDYCVETIIQDYYGFDKITKKGVIKNAKSYLRNKNPSQIYNEIQYLIEKYGIELIRCQDTNFLTIEKKVLSELGELFSLKNIDVMLYIETRPEGINTGTVKLLRKLKVDGVGMGIETSSESFRESSLNRFADQKRIINAFKILKENDIKRTAYNIIGLPNENEESIINTIKFNSLLNPDNITVAFYSPYIGTAQEKKAKNMNYFSNYEKDVDGQLRSLNTSGLLSIGLLNFYKKYFNYFVRNGFDDIVHLKREFINNG